MERRTASRSFQPGSNLPNCTTTQRIRKEWRQLTPGERELFVSTIEQAIERNLLQTFLDYHIDSRSAFQSHGTCGFALWHRRFLLAAEDMLRDIDPPRTSCLTVPYWDISLDFGRQVKGECFSFASCAPGLFHDMMGGVPGLFEDLGDVVTTTRQFGTIYSSSGVLVNGRPVANLTDDKGHLGVVRGDLFQAPLPPSADRRDVSRLILENPDFDSFTHKMQESIHDDVHVAIGGFMPTFSSPTDVFFWVWHSTIDLIYNLWQGCRYPEPMLVKEEFMGSKYCNVRPLWSDSDFLVGGPPPLEYPSGINLQPSSNEAMIIEKQMDSTSTLDVRNDSTIGEYFEDARHFWEVADVRTMSAERSFTFGLVPHDLAIWNTEDMKNFCTYHDHTTTLQLTSHSSTEGSDKEWFYPYSDLERLIQDSIANVFLQNDPLREDPGVQTERLQYVSCAVLYTRGGIVSDLRKWERLLEDVRDRTQQLPQGGPERCSFLWPGAWIPPTEPYTDDFDGNPTGNSTVGLPPSSDGVSFPIEDHNSSSMTASSGLCHGISDVMVFSLVLLMLINF